VANREFQNESQQIQLNEDQSRQLVEHLLAPPHPPSAEIKKVVIRYRELVKEDALETWAAEANKFLGTTRR
jgi:uncharacterized protein (DUF1778 family)